MKRQKTLCRGCMGHGYNIVYYYTKENEATGGRQESPCPICSGTGTIYGRYVSTEASASTEEETIPHSSTVQARTTQKP